MSFLGGLFGSDTPDAPDMTEEIERAHDLSDRAQGFQDDLFAQFDAWQDIGLREYQDAVAQNKEFVGLQNTWAQQDRARQKLFQQQEDRLIERADELEDPHYKALREAKRKAEAQQMFDAQRENAMVQATSLGYDPSQISQGAIDIDSRNKLAAQQASAAELGRQMDQQYADNLRLQLAGKAPQYGALASGNLQTAQGANLQNVNQAGLAANVGGAQLAATGQYGNQALASLDSAASYKNAEFANQLAASQARAAASPGAAFGNIAGMAAGVGLGTLTGGLGTAAAESITSSLTSAEGGVVPHEAALPELATPQAPTDTVPAKLTPDEYIVPADVMKWKGQEFFEKLVASSREKSQQTGTTAGQPRPQAPQTGAVA